MEEQVGVAQLLQRGLKGLHQMVGQLADEAHGVAEQHGAVSLISSVRVVVSGVERPVVGGDVAPVSRLSRVDLPALV